MLRRAGLNVTTNGILFVSFVLVADRAVLHGIALTFWICSVTQGIIIPSSFDQMSG